MVTVSLSVCYSDHCEFRTRHQCVTCAPLSQNFQIDKWTDKLANLNKYVPQGHKNIFLVPQFIKISIVTGCFISALCGIKIGQ